MQVYSDNLLDDCIERAARYGPPVTAAQKEQAWQRVRERAVLQTPLPPLLAVPAAPPPRSLPSRALGALSAVLQVCIADDRALRRASHRQVPHQRLLDRAIYRGFCAA